MEPTDATLKLTARQQLVIDAIATGLPIVRVAEQIGVARRTIYNWLEDPAFQSGLAQRRRELADTVADRVAELGQTCLTTLVDYLTSDEKSSYKPAKVELATD